MTSASPPKVSPACSPHANVPADLSRSSPMATTTSSSLLQTPKKEEASIEEISTSAGPGPLDILCQIFPARPRCQLQAILRENHGDLVRSLETCAKIIPSDRETSSSSRSSSHHRRHNVKHHDINGNGFNHHFGLGASSSSSAAMGGGPGYSKFLSSPLGGPMSHKSAFVPTHPYRSASTSSSQTSVASLFPSSHDPLLPYPSFLPAPNHSAAAAAAKEFFPFPPPFFSAAAAAAYGSFGGLINPMSSRSSSLFASPASSASSAAFHRALMSPDGGPGSFLPPPGSDSTEQDVKDV